MVLFFTSLLADHKVTFVLDFPGVRVGPLLFEVFVDISSFITSNQPTSMFSFFQSVDLAPNPSRADARGVI